MRLKAFERCAPEAVGIDSRAVGRFLDVLEQGGFTQMHGLMIMRHGKVCAEGWWAPFAPQLHHCCHSLSKTYTATAIGIAEKEGLLSLSDRIADIFPEAVLPDSPERLLRLTVRDLLVMGAGMEDEPEGYPENWRVRFLNQAYPHEPGTFWRYSSQATSCLSSVVERLSGQTLTEYLTPRLFDKIGIAAQNVMCRTAADGASLGGSGLFTTTEDNLRLMKLYLDGGVWKGERILSERFVREATSAQMDTYPAHAHTPWITENCVGYGYQIWMCRLPGSYRADGAYGQFSVVIPQLDLIVSISESAYLGDRLAHSQLHLLKGQSGEDAPVHGPQATLNALFDVLLPGVLPEGTLAPNPQEAKALAARMQALQVPDPAPVRVSGPEGFCARLEAQEGAISFGILYGMKRNRIAYPGAKTIALRVVGGALHVSYEEGGESRAFAAALDGGVTEGTLAYPGEIVNRIAARAWWESENRLCLSVLWHETEMENRYAMTFGGKTVTVEKWIGGGVFGAQAMERAMYNLTTTGE